ncbi:MAG: hypothetical protein JWR37_3099 [Mycobacterium sp.]|jgi:hypothetical protein|nr:hypothetical protein [Mycobacterium sp.]
MGQFNRLIIGAARVAVATVPTMMLGIGAGTAAAAPPSTGGGTMVPFSIVLRRCDFSNNAYTGVLAHGTGFAIIRTGEWNHKVTAEVHLSTASSDTRFTVKLIQLPRPGYTCNPGDPGTAFATLDTDAAGNANVITLQQDVLPGATGAWVYIDGPAPYGAPTEFYSSDFVVPI